jgi:alpha-galactosidase
MKIVMIGGGSCNWSPKLICDIIHEESLDGSEIWLEDIDLKAAERIKAAGERLAKDNNRKLTFIVTNDEDAAFRGADIILITISTGGLTTMRPDVELPERYGIYQPIGDTVGPGGWSRTLRNVPVFAAWAEKFRRLCPNAFILNYTNPMASLTGVFHAIAPELKVLGLCHGPVGTMHFLAKMFDTDVKNISAKVGGINHFFWILDFTVNGKDGYSMLKDRLAGRHIYELDKGYDPENGIFMRDHRVMSEIYEKFGYLTYTADNHTSEFLPGYLLDLNAVDEYKIFRKKIDWRAEGYEKAWERVDKLTSGEEQISPPSIEVAVKVMDSIQTGRSYLDIVNLPNNGQITNLPKDAVVETFGSIGPTGFQPVGVGDLPPELLGLTLPHCNIQLMTLEAALTGNKRLALQALMLDPLCHKLTFAQITKMGEELMEANRDWLPQFFKK